jgi:hypothetical protein
MLPCALCRAPRRKTHDKEFAVRFRAFAVRHGRTAKPLFPVVRDNDDTELNQDNCQITYHFDLFYYAPFMSAYVAKEM